MIVNHISQGRPGGGAGGWRGRGWWDQCDARERGKRIHIIHKHAALALSTESGGGGAPHHDRRLSCRATPASQSRGPVECPESSPAGLAASSQQRSRATAPVSIAHHRHHHRSLARVIARSKEPPAEPGRQSAVARRAPPAPSRRLLARPRPASHSWAHPFPFPFPPHHTTVRAAPSASGGLQTPGRTRRGAEPLYSPLHASKRESEPVAVLLIPLVIVTTPYYTDTSQSIFGPPRIPGAGTTPSMRHSSPVSGPATGLQRLRLGIRSRCKRREGDP